MHCSFMYCHLKTFESLCCLHVLLVYVMESLENEQRNALFQIYINFHLCPTPSNNKNKQIALAYQRY